jgi:hypothetical protein
MHCIADLLVVWTDLGGQGNHIISIGCCGDWNGQDLFDCIDVTNFNPKKILFIMHREEILKSTESTV